MTYQPESWDLTELGKEKSRVWGETQLEQLKKQCDQLVSFKDSFVETISDSEFLKFLNLLESFTTLESRLVQFSYLWFSENTKDPDALAFKSKVSLTAADLSNELLFFHLRFVRFSPSNIERLIKAAPQCAYMLRELAKKKEHMLAEEQEKIINIKDANGVSKLYSVYNIFTNGFTYEWDGKNVTQSEVMQNAHNPDPALREKAYKMVLGRYRENEAVLGEIYQGIVLDWQKENLDLRGYKSSISVRNSANDVPDEAVSILLSLAEKNKDIFSKYFALKAKQLGTTKLRRFDLYAPIQKPEKKISYAEGVEMVLDTFKHFHQSFYDGAKKMIDHKHLHSSIAKGKMSGGYCYGSDPRVMPYILINYTDDAESVSTLAHELGHGLHYMFASKDHNIFHVNSALPIAETASIFSETLLINKLKEKFPDLFVSLSFDQLDRIYASIGRQLEFVNFEVAAHALILKGASVKEVKDLYLTRLCNHFGEHVDVSDDYANEWNYVPHIYDRPFYCYAYGFGNLLSLCVFAKYQELGAPFAEKIIQALAAGGSMPPRDIVKILGFDICDESFWQSGFDIIRTFVDDLETHMTSK